MSDDFMKRLKAFAFVVLALAVVAYVYQYGRFVNLTNQNSFNVTGEATMETATDIATFTASVVTEGGNNVADIQKQNVEKMNAINAFLKEQGVEKKDLKTSQYTLSPRYSYPKCEGQSVCPPPSISGYTLTQALTVKVRDLEKLGNILSGITEKGANTVSGINFTVDDDSDARQKARIEAISDAQKKARDIAKAGNFMVGRLISVFEEENTGIQPDVSAGFGGASEVKATPPVIEPGTKSEKVRMNLTYEIRN
jgi:uncharacterized protein YggE